MSFHPAIKYGLATGAAVWFVGFATGLGGAFMTNLAFSCAMGALASLCFLGAMWLSGRGAGARTGTSTNARSDTRGADLSAGSDQDNGGA